MQLKQILDPRGPLDRVNRDQMREYAERNGINEITWDMTGDEMRYILRKKGVTNLGVPHQILGTKSNLMVQADHDPTVPQMTLEDLQRQQWELNARERENRQKDRKETEENEELKAMIMTQTATRAQLAKQCKRLGIKMQRTDTKEKLLERLSGQSHAA